MAAIGRHVAPAEHHHAVIFHHLREDGFAELAGSVVLAQEKRADGILARLGKRKAQLFALSRRNGSGMRSRMPRRRRCPLRSRRLHDDSCSPASERVGDDLVRRLALDVANEAHTASVVFIFGRVQSLSGR